MKPALNPIEAPDLVCTECSQLMRRVIVPRNPSGKLDSIVYHCDTLKCQYAMSISLEHKNAQNAKYESPLVVTPVVVETPAEPPQVVEETPAEDDGTDEEVVIQ